MHITVRALNRNKENADAIMNSNEQLMRRLSILENKSRRVMILLLRARNDL